MTTRKDVGTFVQGSPHPAWLTDSGGRCSYANPALSKLTGLSSAQLEQMNWLEFVVEGDRADASFLWQESRATGTPYRACLSLRCAGPAPGANVELIAFDHDTSLLDEVWLFAALRLRGSTLQHLPLEAQLQETLNLLPIQAWYTRASWTRSFVNEAAANYLGLSEDHPLRFGAVMDTPWDARLAFLHPEDREHSSRQWAERLRTGEVKEDQFRVLSASGQYRWFLSRTHPLRDIDGHLLFWVGVNVDIDDEKRADYALDAAREQITRATQFATISELSSSISHEIVQPLAAVVANARAALNWLSGREPDIAQAKSAMEGILRDGMSVGNVVHEMRRLFRRQQPNRQAIELNNLVEQVLRLTQPDLGNRGIIVSLELMADLPTTEADGIQIQQVLFNLIENAWEVLTQSSGSKEVTVRTFCDHESVSVEIEDNGVGITSPERIFEAFFTSKPGSLGVGLAISRSIAEAHGGTLEASSRVHGGACFRLTLPRSPTELEAGDS
jgi:PAS domain S-box-containing protein